MGFIFSEVMGSSLILWFAVIFSILMSAGSYWYSDKIVLKMSKAHLVEFDDNKELYRLVENLCITAGLPLPKIYLIDDTAPNAFATGRDPEHAVVAVTSGLLQKLNRSELEGVIAHELSHIGNRDILLATVVVVLVGIVALLADFFRNWVWFGGSRRNNDRGGGWLIIVAIILSILAPVFAMLIQLAISRKREFLADADGALLTRYPEGLASALKKISADSEKLEVANRATAHLYFANPFKGKKVSKLLMTHPPVEERIASLMGMPSSQKDVK
ncbi:M48 family metallopeptidase [Candidatus Parcubacteria bacterium]|nr:M48 family metallopeptidase [Candidatus Parcubacteria bacterium]